MFKFMLAEIVKREADKLMREYETQSNPAIEDAVDGLDTVETVRTMFRMLIARLSMNENSAEVAKNE